MILKLKMLKNFRVLKTGEEFEFRPGVNLLVGEQGSGKSSLIKLVRENTNHFKDTRTLDTDKPTATRSFDFEKDNPRTQSSIETMTGFVCLMSSHGEVTRQMAKDFGDMKDVLIIMDEPDMALSIRSCYLLIECMKKAVSNDCQVLAAVHNPIVVAAFPEVLSMEHRKWMPSKEFIASHTP